MKIPVKKTVKMPLRFNSCEKEKIPSITCLLNGIHNLVKYVDLFTSANMYERYAIRTIREISLTDECLGTKINTRSIHIAQSKASIKFHFAYKSFLLAMLWVRQLDITRLHMHK